MEEVEDGVAVNRSWDTRVGTMELRIPKWCENVSFLYRDLRWCGSMFISSTEWLGFCVVAIVEKESDRTGLEVGKETTSGQQI